MKLDPFQPILRPHGFLRPLHYYSFSFSPKHLPSLNTPPLSKQVAVLLLSLSLSTPIRTNGSLFLTVRQPGANAKARERNASPFTRRSSPWEWEQWERGERGAPLLTRFTEKGRKRGTAARSGGDCVARIANYRFRFFREFLLSSLAERGEHWMNFFESFVKSFFSCTTRRNIVLKDWTMRSRGWKGVEIGYIFRRNNYFLP